MSPRTKTGGKDRLLEAAERLIVEGGLGKLSVDSVLTEAGLSKGAFFHHFESKDALLAALVERLAGETERHLAERSGADPDKRGRRLRTQIELTFGADNAQRARLKALVLAFIEAAIAGSPFVKAARETNEAELRENLRDELPVGDALLVQFALDGFWLNETLGATRLSRSMKQALRDSLVRLTRTRKERP
jgi:AcrR family transcriptional regulator